MGHLICQLEASEGKDSKIACNPYYKKVTGLNKFASINLARRQIISQSTFFNEITLTAGWPNPYPEIMLPELVF